jgi:septal ring factor EnvC (AmiA/AmiB activator)
MLDEKAFEQLLQELASLNANLEKYGPQSKRIADELEKLNKNIHVVAATGKEIWRLNQIMLQVRKSQGNVAMVKQFFDAVSGSFFGRKP